MSIGSATRGEKTACLLIRLLCPPEENKGVCSSYSSSDFLRVSQIMALPTTGSVNSAHNEIQQDHWRCNTASFVPHCTRECSQWNRQEKENLSRLKEKSKNISNLKNHYHLCRKYHWNLKKKKKLLKVIRASLVAQLVKNLPAMLETWFDPWVGKIPWRRDRLPTPVFWPGEFHGL